MVTYLFFNVFVFVVSVAFVLFLKSKRGQKWLREL